MRRLPLALAILALGAAPAAADLPPSDEALAPSLNAAHTNALGGDWLAGPLEEAWRLPSVRLANAPLVTRDRVIVADYTDQSSFNDVRIRVLDRMTGEVLWKRESYRPELGAGEGLVLITSERSHEPGVYSGLTAYDLDTGVVRWDIGAPDDIRSGPLVHDGLVFTAASRTHAFEIADGHLRWTAPGDTAQPAVAGGRAYTGLNVCHQLFVHDEDLGVPVASRQSTTCLAGTYTPPVVSGSWVWGENARFDRATLALDDGYDGEGAHAGGLRLRSTKDPSELQAFDEATGDLRWSVPGIPSRPLVVGDTVAATSDAGAVVLHDRLTGAPLWSGSPSGFAFGLVGAGQGLLLAESGDPTSSAPPDLVALGAPGPDTAIRTRPDEVVASGAAAFTFASTAAGAYECALDDGAFAACSSPYTVTGLADGPHALRVRALGDRTPALARWAVDRSALPSAITSGPPARTASGSADFGFTIGEHARRIECRLDGGAWERCAPPVAYRNLQHGEHRFELRATDRAGNVEDPPRSRTWTVDQHAPTVSELDGPPATTTSREATFTFAASEPNASFECKIDGSPWEPCSSPKDYPDLALGDHEVSVRATDDVGNGPGPVRSRTWRIEAEAAAHSQRPAEPAVQVAPALLPAPSPALELRVPSRARRAELMRGLRVRLAGLRKGARVSVVIRVRGRVVARRTVQARGAAMTIPVKVRPAKLRGARRVTVRVTASGRSVSSAVRLGR